MTRFIVLFGCDNKEPVIIPNQRSEFAAVKNCKENHGVSVWCLEKGAVTIQNKASFGYENGGYTLGEVKSPDQIYPHDLALKFSTYHMKVGKLIVDDQT